MYRRRLGHRRDALDHRTRCQGGLFPHHTGHVFGVRTLDDGFYLRELCDYAGQAQGRLEVTLALSHAPAPAAAHPEFPHIRLMEGMVADAPGRR